MAKVLITGALEWEFEDEKTGRPVSGMTVYYKNLLKSNENRFAAGYASGKLSVRIGSELYKRLIATDFSKPFEAEPLYEFVPGKKGGELVDISI